MIGDQISELDRTRARQTEIVQVLVNLLNNAFDAIQGQSQGWARIGIISEDGHFLIEVVDSGLKISREVAEHMMEPFFATKLMGQGTGLGLSVSRQFIENHQSQLVYDFGYSNTRFYFKLVRL